jgi:hypothetical protein
VQLLVRAQSLGPAIDTTAAGSPAFTSAPYQVGGTSPRRFISVEMNGVTPSVYGAGTIQKPATAAPGSVVMGTR